MIWFIIIKNVKISLATKNLLGEGWLYQRKSFCGAILPLKSSDFSKCSCAQCKIHASSAEARNDVQKTFALQLFKEDLHFGTFALTTSAIAQNWNASECDHLFEQIKMNY